MPKRTVLFDSVGYVEKLDDGTTAHRYAFRGDEVELSDAEVSRLEELGAVGSEEDLRQAEEELESTPQGRTVSTDELKGMTVEELSAHLTQNPADVDRVEELEQAREKPRKGVLEYVESVRNAEAEANPEETGDGSDEGAGDGSSE